MDIKGKGVERMTEKRFSIELTTINECIVDNTTGEQLDTSNYTERLCEVLNALHEENIMLKQKIDRQLHRNKRYSRQNEEVMGFLHDNYYSIWEEVLKECYHD